MCSEHQRRGPDPTPFRYSHRMRGRGVATHLDSGHFLLCFWCKVSMTLRGCVVYRLRAAPREHLVVWFRIVGLGGWVGVCDGSPCFCCTSSIFADGLILVWGSRGLVQLPGPKKGFGADLGGIADTFRYRADLQREVLFFYFISLQLTLHKMEGGNGITGGWFPTRHHSFHPPEPFSSTGNDFFSGGGGGRKGEEGEKKRRREKEEAGGGQNTGGGGGGGMKKDEARLELGGNMCIHRGTTIGESAARYEKQATFAHLVTDLIGLTVFNVDGGQITRPIFASFLISVLCTSWLVSSATKKWAITKESPSEWLTHADASLVVAVLQPHLFFFFFCIYTTFAQPDASDLILADPFWGKVGRPGRRVGGGDTYISIRTWRGGLFQDNVEYVIAEHENVSCFTLYSEYTVGRPPFSPSFPPREPLLIAGLETRKCRLGLWHSVAFPSVSSSVFVTPSEAASVVRREELEGNFVCGFCSSLSHWGFTFENPEDLRPISDSIGFLVVVSSLCCRSYFVLMRADLGETLGIGLMALLGDVADAIVRDVSMTRGGEVWCFVLSHSLLSVNNITTSSAKNVSSISDVLSAINSCQNVSKFSNNLLGGIDQLTRRLLITDILEHLERPPQSSAKVSLVLGQNHPEEFDASNNDQHSAIRSIKQPVMRASNRRQILNAASMHLRRPSSPETGSMEKLNKMTKVQNIEKEKDSTHCSETRLGGGVSSLPGSNRRFSLILDRNCNRSGIGV
ncbi:hypothetical protein CCUS01_05837 [Colletotrichum cuscutae]|uniref:Uncharacterized protein n=1 Tax=Colletotrichum cuscutae TaxID=1209917 RepID=A0AAI9Y4P3_9PEZI|nr:hypothetical protein CCUS01_05837 [Colletotrichum cuscutae]